MTSNRDKMTSAMHGLNGSRNCCTSCTFIVWESRHINLTHTDSFTAALAVHTLQHFSWKHAHPLSMLCVILYTCQTLAVVLPSKVHLSQ